MEDLNNHSSSSLIRPEDRILVTGASGFLGPRVLENLLARGFRNIRCFSRPSGNAERILAIAEKRGATGAIEVVRGNLLSKDDCRRAAENVALVYHLAAGRGEKFVPDAFMNSVVTTRNLLEACGGLAGLKRFVSVSSFSVYGRSSLRGRLLDETCPVEDRPDLRGDAYTYAKVKQDEILHEMASRLRIPYVILRPGVIYGPGNEAIHGRIGIGTFGLFLHLGGSNSIPLTYVDNCAEAIVLAGLKPGVDGEVFNVVDDDLPSSRRFLRLYKKNVRRFPSVFLPHIVSYSLCRLWEKYSSWSGGQLPPVFNRRSWHAYWKSTRYSNAKLKERLGWRPVVAAPDGLTRHFESCRAKLRTRQTA